MNFKNLKIKNLLLNLFICFLYPLFRLIVSNNKMLALSDSCFILGLLLVLLGGVNILLIHGDLDITGYIANRAFNKDSTQDYKAFKKEREAKRKDSFNYPLLCGIILLLIAYIVSLFA